MAYDYLYIMFDILNHEGFPNISAKGKLLVGNLVSLWYCSIAIDTGKIKFVPVS